MSNIEDTVDYVEWCTTPLSV